MIGSGSAAPSNGAEAEHDVAIFPLAVPSIASPGSILAALAVEMILESVGELLIEMRAV
jgi:multiple antibiotic resistance protein